MTASMANESRDYNFVLKVTAFLLPLLLFANTYDGEFVYDDRLVLMHTAVSHCRSRAIVSNADVTGARPVWQVFAHDFWGVPLTHNGSHKSYRPLTTLTFRCNWFWGNGGPNR
jgi:hypothetical protein